MSEGYLQIGERMITKPIGYKKKVVFSKNGSTASRNWLSNTHTGSFFKKIKLHKCLLVP